MTASPGRTSRVTSAPLSRAFNRVARLIPGVGGKAPNPWYAVVDTGSREKVATSPAGPGSIRRKLTCRNDRICRAS
jgi:hypothetical protein